MTNFFISRPILAIILSIVITTLGLTCLTFLPVELLPNLASPTVSISAHLSGANAETIALSIADPIEKAIIGTENMSYFSSDSSTPGEMNLTAYFRTGTDLQTALRDIQKRVDQASYSIPEEVKKNGIQVSGTSSSILLFIAIEDLKGLYNEEFLTNYAALHIIPELQRVPGISSASVANAADYSMRIWLKPDLLAQFKLSTTDVKNAIQEQNAVHTIGEIGQEPAPSNTKLTIPLFSGGFLKNVEEFENIILKADPQGSIVRLKDVSRIELGSQSYNSYGTVNGKIGAFISIQPFENANGLVVGNRIKEKLAQMSQFFPPGITYTIPYDTTKYIEISVKEIINTLIGAILLVSLIIFFFLHRFLAALVPIIAMILSIFGTFIGMYLLGYSLNMLTLFGMILAVGIVVDDAIIIVEKVEANIRTLGLSSKNAALRAMKYLTAPIIAIVFALFAIFIPVSFMAGIAGQLYKQFAVTIVISVVISGFVALTISPVLSVIFFKKTANPTTFSTKFNKIFDKITKGYIDGVKWLAKRRGIGLGVWVLSLFVIGILFYRLPKELIPEEDQGALIISAELPAGASLGRTKEVSSQIEQIIQEQKGIQDYISLSGVGGSNSAIFYVGLKDWSKRKAPALHANNIIKSLNGKFELIPEAEIIAFGLPPIPEAGNSDAYSLWILNQGNWTSEDLQRVVEQIVEKGKGNSAFSYLTGATSTRSLGIQVDVDKVKAKAYGVDINDIFYTLQVLFGSSYVNDFTDLGRLFKVIMQADSPWRNTAGLDYVGNIFVPSSGENMIPLKSLVNLKFGMQSNSISHYNGSPARLISIGLAAPPNRVISTMEEIAKSCLLPGMSFAWSGAAYQTRAAANQVIFALVGGLFTLFLCLAALYGRWILPVTIFLAVPFGILGALLAIWIRGIPMDLYFQVGLIASIGISAKNAILIVEKARTNTEEGMGAFDSAVNAAQSRFRPIILTSLCLILAVFPLTISTGAGAASFRSVGTGVLGGMFLATLMAIFFVPLFFCLLEKEAKK